MKINQSDVCHLFCADNVIIRHTAQFVYPTVNRVVLVVLNPRVGQIFVDTAQISEHLSNTTGQGVVID